MQVSLITACAMLLFATFTFATTEHHPLSDEFISLINSKQNSWRAGRNFASDISMTYIKGLMGLIKSDHPLTLPVKVHDPELIASLPEHFDPREKWPHCASLNEIRDQGSCGSCWAFAAVEAMTDRVCIYSNGTKNFHFSAQDLVSCCLFCGSGCEGGISVFAWKYWETDGIVSGGPYNSSQGCRPYEIAPCAHHGTQVPSDTNSLPPCHKSDHTPKCIKKCESSYNADYDKDKLKAKTVYMVKDEDHIKAELFENGPVEAGFEVYADFIHYKSGVYFYSGGDYQDRHAVKMMGWGVENGTKYWLVANSWNSGWGDQGYFKIRRGTDECGIESEITTGEPAL